MNKTNKRLKFFVWCAVVFCIMGSGLYVWESKVEPEAEHTAFIVAQRQILSSANTYHQEWMLRETPKTAIIDDHKVSFTSSGWPVVMNNGKLNCEKWLLLLWPDSKVFGQQYSVNKKGEGRKNVQCDYRFSQGQKIVLQLKHGYFEVGIQDAS